MELTIAILDNRENFLEFLDPSRCELIESHKIDGMRTLELEYEFRDFLKDRDLFNIGNKIWIQGDNNLENCLYVINTSVKQDVYAKNKFSLELEEVLVELNYAPIFFQTELTAGNGFKLRTSNGVAQVKVELNALKYWFGDYFNLGVIQECLNDYVAWINITGSINRMSLLRKIEEDTGNVLITRYEKDVLNNTIHRYLDFLNPLNSAKDWTLNIEYDFLSTASLTPIIDDEPWAVKRHIDNIPAESKEEDVWTEDWVDWYVKGTEDPNWKWDREKETGPLYDYRNDYTPLVNINPTNIAFRVVDKNCDIVTDLVWTSEDVGFDNTQTHALITLCSVNEVLGMVVNNRTFAVIPDDTTDEGLADYLDYTETIYEDMDDDNTRSNIVLPDDCYFEMVDTLNERVVFRTQINREIGTVHEEVLDFNFNISNIEYEIDETSTYTAVTPVIEQKQSEDADSLSRLDIDTLIVRWKNLAVQKGDIIPMIVERAFVNATTWTNAVESLGTVDPATNYWQKPFKQQNQLNDSDSSQNKWEVWKATAYWKAPFTKNKGEMHISCVESQSVQYSHVIGRNDTRNEKGPATTEKMGNTTTTDEDIYAIYNQVVNYLKNHQTPDIDLHVDVANLQDGKYNDYQIHDKVYIKLPDSNELITARVGETHKEANNPAKNSIKLVNYTNRNTLRTLQQSTIINAENTTFKYPTTKTIMINLENLDYDSSDPYSVHYLGNKLLSLTLYRVENGSSSFERVYTKRTNSNGNISLVMDYDPGNYKLVIRFSGDEEYLETELSIKINVSGVKEVVELKITKPEPIVREDAQAESVVSGETRTTYYDKYGRTPDKSKILAIGRISASRDTGSYANFYETEFVNKCPHCGKQSLVWGIFWAGNEYSNYGRFPGTGYKEGGSAEGHIFCTKCDADYSVQGNEHVSNGKRLTKTKNTIISSKDKAYELRNGKRVYSITSIDNDEEGFGSVDRKQIGNISSDVKKQAIAIVGSKTGMAAAKAIASWMDKNIWYLYYTNFNRSASKVLSTKYGNCCDQTRLFLEMCDVAGCAEFFKMEYIHVSNHVYAGLTAKSTGKYYTVDCASDSHGAWDYVCRDYRTAVLRRTTYPTRPF